MSDCVNLESLARALCARIKREYAVRTMCCISKTKCPLNKLVAVKRLLNHMLST